MGSHSLSRTDPRVRDFWSERHLCAVTFATLRADEASILDAVRLYSSRDPQPRPNPDRVAIHVAIDAILGRVS